MSKRHILKVKTVTHGYNLPKISDIWVMSSTAYTLDALRFYVWHNFWTKIWSYQKATAVFNKRTISCRMAFSEDMLSTKLVYVLAIYYMHKNLSKKLFGRLDGLSARFFRYVRRSG